jgi:hypothetical protein
MATKFSYLVRSAIFAGKLVGAHGLGNLFGVKIVKMINMQGILLKSI